MYLMSYSYDEEYVDSPRPGSVPQQPKEGGRAVATGSLTLNPGAFQVFMTGSAAGGSEIWWQARLAGIIATKGANQFLNLTHTINVTGVDISFEAVEAEKRINVSCEVRVRERHGAEACALLGCGMTLMAISNSLRVIDREILIEQLKVQKESS